MELHHFVTMFVNQMSFSLHFKIDFWFIELKGWSLLSLK